LIFFSKPGFLDFITLRWITCFSGFHASGSHALVDHMLSDFMPGAGKAAVKTCHLPLQSIKSGINTKNRPNSTLHTGASAGAGTVQLSAMSA
jgi:hypothetical protein